MDKHWKGRLHRVPIGHGDTVAYLAVHGKPGCSPEGICGRPSSYLGRNSRSPCVLHRPAEDVVGAHAVCGEKSEVRVKRRGRARAFHARGCSHGRTRRPVVLCGALCRPTQRVQAHAAPWTVSNLVLLASVRALGPPERKQSGPVGHRAFKAPRRAVPHALYVEVRSRHGFFDTVCGTLEWACRNVATFT